MSALITLGKATLEAGVNSVRAVAAGTANHAFRRGKEAFNESLRETGEPCPVGEVIVEHDHAGADCYSFGWHAGPMSKLADQIAKGEIDDRGADLYFGTRSVAAHFGGREKDSVILLLAACRDTPVSVNEVFGTQYFPGGTMGSVRVLAAHRISPAWARYSSDVSTHTPSIQRAVLAVRAVADAMRVNLEN
ncbi:hypothetical protein K0U07_01350 [bacterium]|nr:hypothetical protein [bacterium]